MCRMTPRELLEFADRIASDLLEIGHGQQIPKRDLLMAVVIAQKLLQGVLYHGDDIEVSEAAQEADATYKAASSILEVN